MENSSSRSLRVALVSHTNLPWVEPLTRALTERGHGVRIFSFYPEPIPGLDCVALGDDPALPFWRYVTAAPRLRRALREFAPDVVLATYLSSNGVSTALAWRGPLVLSLAGSDVLPEATAGIQRLPLPLQRALVRFVGRRARPIHSVSRQITETMVGYGVDAARIETFARGTRLDRFPLSTRTEPCDPPRILCTRKQRPEYDNHLLVEALGRLRASGRAFQATLVGGGPLLEERRAQVHTLGLDDVVSLEGQVPHEALPGFLEGSDVYVSAAPSDGTSSSLLEAMAAGLFPVVTRIPANTDWVEHGRDGLLFDVGDAADLEAQLARALDDAALRRDARPRNRARVEADGDYRKNIERMIGLLHAAAER